LVNLSPLRSFSSNSRKNGRTGSANLIIWVRTSSQYGLNSYLYLNQLLTLPERDWIAQEISNFLDIPLIEE
jgi:hypothetical protein